MEYGRFSVDMANSACNTALSNQSVLHSRLECGKFSVDMANSTYSSAVILFPDKTLACLSSK